VSKPVSRVSHLADGIFRIADTCHVYVIAADADGSGERTGVAVDFGSGLVLDHLDELGLDRITDVVMTHHHRDQAQGLARAAAAGIRIHVPPVEQDLFAEASEFWRTRPLYNDYVLRQDKFTILDSVPVHGLVPEQAEALRALEQELARLDQNSLTLLHQLRGGEEGALRIWALAHKMKLK